MSKGSEFSIHCQSCSFSHLCLPVSLNKTELDSLDDIIERKKPLHKHDKLVKAGDKFNSLVSQYALARLNRSSVARTAKNKLLVFIFPGDIIGFDALRVKIRSPKLYASAGNSHGLRITL